VNKWLNASAKHASDKGFEATPFSVKLANVKPDLPAVISEGLSRRL